MARLGATLVVRDIGASAKYYVEHFGAELPHEEFQPDTYQVLDFSSGSIRLVREDLANNVVLSDKNINNGVFISLVVDDIDETVYHLTSEADCTIIQRIDTNGRSATKNALIEDFFGFTWQLIQASEAEIFSKRYKAAEMELKKKLRGSRI